MSDAPIIDTTPRALPPERATGDPSSAAAGMARAFRGKAALPGFKPSAQAVQEAENRPRPAPQRPVQATSTVPGQVLPPARCEATAVHALPGVRRPIGPSTIRGSMSLAQLAESRGIKLTLPGDGVVFEAPAEGEPVAPVAAADGANAREVMEAADGGDGWSPAEIRRRTSGVDALDAAPKASMTGSRMAAGALALSRRT